MNPPTPAPRYNPMNGKTAKGIAAAILLSTLLIHSPRPARADWVSYTVDSGTGGANVGQYSSFAIVNGNPAVAYHDVTNGDLKYARAANTSGTAWGAPVQVATAGNVGQYASLAVVSGNPAIAYYDVTNGDLKYVRATDASGTAWGAPVTPAATGNVGQYASLAVVFGKPSIAYYDVTNLDLKYVRALDASGTAWDGPTTPAATGDAGQYASLAVVSGNPAISYYDGTNFDDDLKYVRATNAAGSVWGSPVAVDTAGDVGRSSKLGIVNGNPAISYRDTTNTRLKYVRSSSGTGSAWNAPVSLDTSGNVGGSSSLAIVNGVPAISYYDAGNGDLKYVRANDASGTAWDAPYSVDTAGDVGSLYTSLAEVNGDPAISYYDATNGDLKFAQFCVIDTLMAAIPNPAPAASDYFGNSVAVSGNMAVVGAPLDDAGASDAGTAYVFNATTGVLIATLNNPAPATYDNFGISVAVSGNVAVVGAYFDDAGASDAGAAYVFDATTGALITTLSNPAPAAYDFFGRSVAISGNVAVVGAYQDDPGGVSNAGTAYVFNAATGALITTLSNPAPAGVDWFGASVEIDGNVAVVGAQYDDAGANNAGTAYVFNATTGALVATLSNPAPAGGDEFGASVAISGNLAVVGTRFDDAGASDAGTAYVFNATTGALMATLSNPAPAASDRFGVSVAISGNAAVVGAWADDAGASDAGTAYVFNAATGALVATLSNPARIGNILPYPPNLNKSNEKALG